MISELYFIYDRASGIYQAPSLAVTEAAAKREFFNLMSQNSKEALRRFGSDFELVRVGTFDNETCELYVEFKPAIARGSDVLNFEIEDGDE